MTKKLSNEPMYRCHKCNSPVAKERFGRKITTEEYDGDVGLLKKTRYLCRSCWLVKKNSELFIKKIMVAGGGGR